MNPTTEPQSTTTSKGPKKTLVLIMEILTLVVISLVAVMIVLWFRAQLADQAVANFDECKKLYGTVSNNVNKCSTLNGDTYEVEP